jgi:hypothetical protein
MTRPLLLEALITLAVDPSALQEMQNLGIIETFSSWMKDESMKIRDSLRYKMQELVSISLNNDDEVSFESGMSEDGIHEYLYVNLKAIVTNQLDNKTTLVLQANTISSMRKFPNSEAVQEMGCKILACMFGRGRSGSVNSMEAVVRCINSSNAAVVAAAASACRNFCSVQTIADLDSYEAERFVSILLPCFIASTTHFHHHTANTAQYIVTLDRWARQCASRSQE